MFSFCKIAEKKFRWLSLKTFWDEQLLFSEYRPGKHLQQFCGGPEEAAIDKITDQPQ
jgi:hypothetical protein